jgi:hypothetical protein
MQKAKEVVELKVEETKAVAGGRKGTIVGPISFNVLPEGKKKNL